jgi:radial spoke head protein 4A
MLEWGGVYFGEEEVYSLQKSIKKLALMSGASQLRFWGKLYGTEKDYFVVEGELNQSEEKPQDPS